MTVSVSVPDSSGAPSGVLLRRAAAFALFLLLLAAAGMGAAAFVAHAPSFYGTVRAPHSDALTWLSGALGFYFYGESHNVLMLRPVIGVIFSSILTLAGSIAAVPKLFAGIYVAALAAAFALSGLRGRLALLALAILLRTGQGLLIQPLHPDSQNTDFPSFAFTFAGLLPVAAVLGGRRTGRAGAAVLAAGFLLLGFAATIRGPMMVAGPVLLLLVLVWGILDARGAERERGSAGPSGGQPAYRRWWGPAVATVAVCGVAFALPVIGDSALRSALGLDAPGAIAFYSFYSDPTHTLTNDAYFRYVTLRPPTSEVMRDYVLFLLSAPGRQVVLDALLERVTMDGNVLREVGFARVLLAAFAVDLGLRLLALLPAGDGRQPALRRLAEAFPPAGTSVRLAVAAIAAAVEAGALGSAGAVLGLAGLALGWSLAAGRAATLAFGLAYLFGLLFLVLTGTKLYPRIAHTYVFALYAAVLWTLFDPPAVAWDGLRRGMAAAVAGIAILAVLVLVGANGLVATPMKAVYRTEVMGRSAAIKIAEDGRLDRSLYFSGNREILYTRADGLPVGTVRRYRSFSNPNGPAAPVPETVEGQWTHNALFHNPGAFVE